MEEGPSSQQHESSELSHLDGQLQSDLGQENQEQGEEDQAEGQEQGVDDASGQEEQEQLESVWQGGEDIPQQQPPARSEKKSTPKRQKPSLERALEPVAQRGQPRGQFYEMLYEIEHLLKIVQDQRGEKVVIVKWRNFALSQCTRQPLSYIKQIDLMKDEVEKLQEQFQQTKFAPQSIVRVKTKIREYLDGYRKMVFPVAEPSGQTQIQVGGMGPLNVSNQQRQISFQQLTRCQAAAYHSTRKKLQILLNDATEQDYYHLRSVFHDSYLRVKNNRKLYREFGLQKSKSMLPIYQSRQIPRFKTNLGKRKVPKLRMSRQLANHKVEEVIAVQRDGDVFNYCIQENKRVYIATLSEMRKYLPRTLPRFLRELLDLMEEVMHLQIDPDEHFINYRMTRFRESNRAKQIIQLTDKQGQPIYFGADDEDVEENKRIDIDLELHEAERDQQLQEEAQYRGRSMIDIEEEEGQHNQESEMKDQAQQARQSSWDKQKQRRKQMEMEMINLSLKPPTISNLPPANPNNGTQMDIENEGNVQNPNAIQKQDGMIDLNAEQDEQSDEDSQQSSSSAGTFDEDYEEMRQALQYYGVQIDLDQPFDEQQEGQPQEQEVAIDFNLMELQNLRYYDDNGLIETGFQPRLSKKEMKKLDKADKQVLGIKDKKRKDDSEEEKEDGQQQNQNSQEREEMQQEAPEEFDSEAQPESDSEESSDGFGLLKRDKKEEKMMMKKGILPDEQMEDQSLSGFSYSESSLSISLGPNAMDQEPTSRQYVSRHPTHYAQVQAILKRSFNRTKQKVNPSFNPPQVIQISSDSSPLGRSIKRQKRY